MLAYAWLAATVLGIAAFVVLLSAIVASARAGKMALVGLSSAFFAAVVAVFLLSRDPYWIITVTVILVPIAMWMVKRTTRNEAQREQVLKFSGAHVTLMLGSLLFLVPFAWLISTSLKTDEEQAVFPPVWLPTQQIASSTLTNTSGTPAPISWYRKDSEEQVKVAEMEELPTGAIRVQTIDGPTPGNQFETKRADLTKIRSFSPRWKNYSEALAFLPKETHFGLTFLGNTLYLTFLSVIGTLFASSLVAYSFARMTWPGKNLLFMVLLATMMIPGAVTMMPQFLIFRSLGWVDTLLPLWVPAFFGSAFNIFLLRQFFMSIPSELEDAAKIDGCGPFTTYWRIMLPQIKPALAAVSITGVMGAWNNFQGPLIYLSSPEKMTLAYALQLYQQDHGGEPGLLMAASTLVVLPIIVLFFFTQRYFIEGISLSGLGGR